MTAPIEAYQAAALRAYCLVRDARRYLDGAGDLETAWRQVNVFVYEWRTLTRFEARNRAAQLVGIIDEADVATLAAGPTGPRTRESGAQPEGYSDL